MSDFWRGKRVLITGHTGFKGSWLSLWLANKGASVIGIALPPHTEPSLFNLANIQDDIDNQICDINNFNLLSSIIACAKPQIVIHLAAQALVRESYAQPLDTISTNVLGTAHILEAVRRTESIRVALLVTTDKVYRNDGGLYPFREIDPLGGYDPYSASKAAAEIVISSYRDSFLRDKNVAVASARAGNVIGGGDWSLDRLIPDMIRAWLNEKPLTIRNPHAIRPWQHVLEPLDGYLKLCELLWDDCALADAYNFGPFSYEASSVRDIIEYSRKLLQSELQVNYADSAGGPHEADFLRLETSKVSSKLAIYPKWSTHRAVEKTITWYQNHRNGVSARQLCLDDIATYEDPLVGALR